MKTKVQAVALDKQVVELDDRTADSLNGALHQIDKHNFLQPELNKRNQIICSSLGCKNQNLNHIPDWRNWCSFTYMKNQKIVPKMNNYYHYDKDWSNMNMVYVVYMCEKNGSGQIWLL